MFHRWIVLVLALTPLSTAAGSDPLSELRRESKCFEYVLPGDDEIRAAERLFSALLVGIHAPEDLIPKCEALGLDLYLARHGDEELLVVSEMRSRRHGRGFYAFRTRGFVPLVLEAPHVYHDLHTGEIATQLFLESRALACAWNTAPRNAKTRGQTADLAHHDRSYFQAFTRAFGRLHRDGVLLQIHGYAKSKRTTVQGVLSGAIISNGTRKTSRVLATMSDCIGESVGAVISVFPRDTSELGALRNHQGALLRTLGHRGFIHLEFCLELRRKLKASLEVRNSLRSCLPERWK